MADQTCEDRQRAEFFSAKVQRYWAEQGRACLPDEATVDAWHLEWDAYVDAERARVGREDGDASL